MLNRCLIDGQRIYVRRRVSAGTAACQNIKPPCRTKLPLAGIADGRGGAVNDQFRGNAGAIGSATVLRKNRIPGFALHQPICSNPLLTLTRLCRFGYILRSIRH